MITKEYTAANNGRTDGKTHYLIFLADHHGEYTGSLGEVRPTWVKADEDPDGSRVLGHYNCSITARVVWNEFELEQVMLAQSGLPGTMDNMDQFEKVVAELRRKVFTDETLLGLDIDPDGVCPDIWLLEGDARGLCRAYDALFTSLAYDPDQVKADWEQRHPNEPVPSWASGPSGDDDVYDYWPNTMDMLWDFASDLDTIEGNQERTGQVLQMALRVAAGVWGEDLDTDTNEWLGRPWLPDHRPVVAEG